MVQLLPPKSNLLADLLYGATQGAGQYIGEKRQEQMLERQQDKQSKQRLAELFAKESLRSERELSKQQQQQQFGSESANQMVESLLKQGVDPNLAKMYSHAPVGGQTAIINHVLDLESRGMLNPGTADILKNTQTDIYEDQKGQEVGEQINTEKMIEESDFPTLPKSRLKPSEQYQLSKEREKLNTPLYKDATDRFHSLKLENMAYDELNEIEERKTLPTGLGKWNVDWKTGELRIPALANSDTQKFVKIINDFTTKAKDSYGSRITNFELDRFMKRLPTLANSPEGRRSIIDYMQKINSIDRLQKEAIIEVYNHYGIENINYQQAKKLADKIIEKKQKNLIKDVKLTEKNMDKYAKEGRQAIKTKLGKPPTGFVYMMSPDGNVESVPNDKVNDARKDDYEVL